MKRILTLASLLAPTLVFAQQPAPDADKAPVAPIVAKAEQAIAKDLITPLAAQERQRSRFSRARLPATARRVRVLDSTEKKDAKSQTFVTFAVDARHGRYDFDDEELAQIKKDDGWRKDTITGCVYLESGEVFVKKGETFRAAGIMMGKKVKEAPEHTCRASEGELAKK